MIRRILATASFAALGLVSVWWWTGIDEQLCRRFPKLCAPPLGVCGELGKCEISALKDIELALIIFGPALAFGIAAAIFSKRPRGLLFWPALAAGFVMLHWAIMAALRIA